jgi:hypothetical protein
LVLNEKEAKHRQLFRTETEEIEVALMRRPVSPLRAYSIFGMLLGGSTAAATFGRVFGASSIVRLLNTDSYMPLLFLLIIVVCSAAGYAMASNLANQAFSTERFRWTRMLLMMSLIGSAWGVVTGAAGGFFFFGFGAAIGLGLAWPIGAVGFAIFATLHRLLERGGMIDMSHLLPIVCGIPAVIGALIFRATN